MLLAGVMSTEDTDPVVEHVNELFAERMDHDWGVEIVSVTPEK